MVGLGPDEVTSGQSFIFEVPDPGGDPVVLDPDDDVTEAAFHDVQRALSLLDDVPFDRMRRPAVAYLGDTARPGMLWLWECRADVPDRLISTVPQLGQPD